MSKIIERERENVVYENRFATIYDDDVMFPNGAKGKYIKFQWNLDYGVAVLATTENQDKIVLVREYSYRQGEWGWNIPKGMGKKGVEPIEQAINELEEESGFKTKEISFLFKLREVVDTKDGIFFFKATIDFEKSEKEMDVGESISSVELFTKEKAKEMLYSDEITCYHTAVAILHWLSED